MKDASSHLDHGKYVYKLRNESIESIDVDSTSSARIYHDQVCPEVHSIQVTLDSNGLPYAGDATLKMDGIPLKKLTGQAQGTTVLNFTGVDLCKDSSGSSLSTGEQDTLRTASRFHRLSVEFDLDPSIYTDSNFQKAETPFRFVVVEDDTEVDPESAPGTLDDNDYYLIASFDFDNGQDGWTARSFVSSTTTPAPSPGYISFTNGEIVFTGDGSDGNFNNPPTVGTESPCDCCPNLECYNGGANCSSDSPYYDNHACELSNDSDPVSDAHASEWEGGEMWRAIDTSGYKNLILLYTIKEVSGLHDKPHGPCRSCKRKAIGTGRSRGVLPYTNCEEFRENLPNSPVPLGNCVDHGHTEEMFSVLFTPNISSAPPYTGSPLIPNTDNIAKWEYADILTHKYLKGVGTEGDLRVLEFSMHDETDNLGQDEFGLWFRAQLNSDEPGEADKIVIDDIMLLGQKVSSP